MSGRKQQEPEESEVLPIGELVGCRVRVTLQDRTIEAEVFAVDAGTHMVVLQQRLPDARKRNIFTVRDSFIKNIEYLGREPRTDVRKPLPTIAFDKLVQRENAALARIGVGVSSTAQSLFDAISKTYPCKWDGQTLVVVDEVRVASPYTTRDCTCTPGHETARDRVSMIVGQVRKRLGVDA